MKRWIIIIVTLSLALAGCARLKGKANPPSAPAAAPTADAQPSQEGALEEAAEKTAPDLTNMSFVEKNKLYLQLLEEKQAAGVDTTQAEEAYLNSLEASLNGESEQADEYLQEAILLLWNQ